MRYVRTLDELSAQDLPLAGGKGANLGELVRAGFAVPPGFVLTTDAYQQASEERLPPDVADELVEAYRRLGEGPVAVRSSATAEDLPEASFAGQQETYLGVSGEDALRDAVCRCWASLHGERAVHYRAERRIGPDGLALAVVVQQMAPHEVAGVVFTVNPITGTAELLVNAAPGSGEAVVGGEVVPDEWALRRPDGAILRFTPGAGRARAASSPLVRRAPATGCLRPPQLAELADIALRIESHFRAPQDIEWSFGEDTFHVLQARPVTASGA